jgi:hypothetical protein
MNMGDIPIFCIFHFLSLVFYGLDCRSLSLLQWNCIICFWFLSQHVHYWHTEKLLSFYVNFVSCDFAESVYQIQEFFGGVLGSLNIGSYCLQIGIIWLLPSLFESLLFLSVNMGGASIFYFIQFLSSTFYSLDCRGLIRNSSTILNKSGWSGHPCLIPDFRGNGFSFHI